jgi:hypothetical protein
VFLALRRLGQEDCEFKTHVGYIARRSLKKKKGNGMAFSPNSDCVVTHLYARGALYHPYPSQTEVPESAGSYGSIVRQDRGDEYGHSILYACMAISQ